MPCSKNNNLVADGNGAALAIKASDRLCLNEWPQMNNKKVQVAYQILRYLIKHPDAQDTLEHIVGWWFLEQNIRYPKALVKKALDMMVKDGVVIENERPDSRRVYKLYRPKRKKLPC